MTTTIPVAIPNLDPEQLMSSPARATSAMLDSGTISPSDSNYAYGNNIFARWIYVGGTGNITYVKWNGESQLVEAVPAGTLLPFGSIGVLQTGTTATKLVWGN